MVSVLAFFPDDPSSSVAIVVEIVREKNENKQKEGVHSKNFCKLDRFIKNLDDPNWTKCWRKPNLLLTKNIFPRFIQCI